MSKPLLKNYIYISDTKVDMLYSQIPRRTFETIAGELNFDLKLFSLKVSKSGKEDLQESRYAKTQTVVRYLEKHFAPVIGTVDEPKVYIKGVLPMHWCLIPPAYQQSKPRVVYFGGSTEQTILGLGGSPKHMISRTGDATIGEPSSDLPSLTAYLAEELGLARRNKHHEPEWGLDAVEALEQQMQGKRPTYEFLAMFLLDDLAPNRHPRPGAKRIVLGTPIYVAHA